MELPIKLLAVFATVAGIGAATAIFSAGLGAVGSGALFSSEFGHGICDDLVREEGKELLMIWRRGAREKRLGR